MLEDEDDGKSSFFSRMLNQMKMVADQVAQWKVLNLKLDGTLYKKKNGENVTLAVIVSSRAFDCFIILMILINTVTLSLNSYPGSDSHINPNKLFHTIFPYTRVV